MRTAETSLGSTYQSSISADISSKFEIAHSKAWGLSLYNSFSTSCSRLERTWKFFHFLTLSSNLYTYRKISTATSAKAINQGTWGVQCLLTKKGFVRDFEDLLFDFAVACSTIRGLDLVTEGARMDVDIASLRGFIVAMHTRRDVLRLAVTAVLVDDHVAFAHGCRSWFLTLGWLERKSLRRGCLSGVLVLKFLLWRPEWFNILPILKVWGLEWGVRRTSSRHNAFVSKNTLLFVTFRLWRWRTSMLYVLCLPSHWFADPLHAFCVSIHHRIYRDLTTQNSSVIPTCWVQSAILISLNPMGAQPCYPCIVTGLGL